MGQETVAKGEAKPKASGTPEQRSNTKKPRIEATESLLGSVAPARAKANAAGLCDPYVSVAGLPRWTVHGSTYLYATTSKNCHPLIHQVTHQISDFCVQFL
jgi:hypothetical protein